ncbi:MAG: cysteine desulfurase [Verrucomicrobiaceae bacterium]|nr:cysteine desulfurase [Verrucomicrobiaceae bacterium]
MIYLDANATTPLDPAVLEAMMPYLRENPANPSASYVAGRQARRAVEAARAAVAALIGGEGREVVFTSCATESINTVHESVRRLWSEKRLLITTATEHAAGLECANRWQRRGGIAHRLKVDANGLSDLAELESALKSTPAALVSVLWGNNETGVIQPMREIAALAHKHGALVHADAVQMIGKAKLDSEVDFLSLSGHKFHAPKGIGALFVSQRVRFEPLLLGGGQEGGRRSGTENVPGIIGLGKAAELAMDPCDDGLRDAFETQILRAWPGAVIHGQNAPRLPNTTSICLPGIDAAGMLILLDQAGVACSAGSACHTGALHPSHVLEAMGFDARHAASTLRFSFSRMNTMAEVSQAVEIVLAAAQKLRLLAGAETSPLA